MRNSKGVWRIILFAVSALFLIAACSKRDNDGLHPGVVFRDCRNCPEMVVIPPGNFMMGLNGSDSNNEHSVQINKAFAISKTEISRGQFAAFIADSGYSADSGCFTFEDARPARRPDRNWRNPGYPQQDDHPAACINWDDAKAYVNWLAKKSGKNYRLPSEAEWEYACRAGGVHDYCGSQEIDDVAWYRKNSSDGQTHLVRSSEPPKMPTMEDLETPWNGGTNPKAGKQANAWGLYDMSGNVSEWTEDCWNSGFTGAPTNGSTWTSGECKRRVQRGGSWHDYKYGPKATERKQNIATIRISEYGFRPAMTIEAVQKTDEISQPIVAKIKDPQPALDSAIREGSIRKATAEDVKAFRDAYIEKKYVSKNLPVPVTEDALSVTKVDISRAYVVLKKFTYPSGLVNEYRVVFFIPTGVPEPSGEIGHSAFYDFETLTIGCTVARTGGISC